MRLGWLRNPGVDLQVSIGPGHLYLRTVRYPDGKPAEIWATYSADQGIIMALLGSICKTANIALQWGVPLPGDHWFVAGYQLRATRLGGQPPVHQVLFSSILNLIGRLLDYHELGNTSGLNVQPNANADPARVANMEDQIRRDPDAAGKVKITGESCHNCGSRAMGSCGHL
jgi:hypothetical protein